MNCKNCGAPLHGYYCEYCGTKTDYPIPMIHVENPDIATLVCRTEIPLEYMRYMSEDEIASCVKRDMVRSFTEHILDVMDIETWVTPETLTQHFGGRIKVVRPRTNTWGGTK